MSTAVGGLKKALVLGSLAMLAPVALPLLAGSGSDAQAGTYVSGQVVFGGPVAVVGFSYGNPFVYGHVHSSPVFCDHGPLYYYPTHHVYAHYVPRYRYHYYETPRYYGAHHRHYDGCGHSYVRSHYRPSHRHYHGCGHSYGKAFVRDGHRGRGHHGYYAKQNGHDKGRRIRGHSHDD